MKRLFLFIGVVISCLQGWANWNTDLSENTQITPTGLSYYDKALKTNKNGYTYAAFVCPAENSMATRLQIIDKERKTGGRFSYQVNPMPFGCGNPLTNMFNQLLKEARA